MSKTCLFTGTSRGVSLGIVRALVAAGYRVVVTARPVSDLGDKLGGGERVHQTVLDSTVPGSGVATWASLSHGSATTSEVVRRALQRSEGSVRALARRYGISPTTVRKWRKRETVADRHMGPAEPHSTTLSVEEEAMIVAFRRHTLLSLDDCLYALQPSIPRLTRSSARTDACSGTASLGCQTWRATSPPRRSSRAIRLALGPPSLHMDIAEVRTEEGKPCLFVAIDRTSKFAVERLYSEATRPTACQFLELLLEVAPYRIHTLLTDNGIQFADQPRNRNTAFSRQSRFDMICEANDIEHRLDLAEPSVE